MEAHHDDGKSSAMKKPFSHPRAIVESSRVGAGAVVTTSVVDHALVRLSGWRLKGWMRQAVAPWLPPAIVHGRKQGFILPLGE